MTTGTRGGITTTGRRAAVWAAATLPAAAAGWAAEEPFPELPATAPADTARTFRIRHGFTLDLVAAEPLVTSPVAVAYDEDGNAYVAEMRDYPYTDARTHQAYKDNTTDAPIGRVTKLIDRDGDGRFDESHVFVDGLSWPTGVAVWQGGIYVTATPDVWYFKDTDGDHRADVREKAFGGFRKFNVQAVINTPLWSPENRIVFAGGTNGGQVTMARFPDERPLRVARNDLRIDPRNGRIEAIAGGARFGHSIDDYGNRFLCTIRNPAQHVVFDGTLAARNPFLPAPNPVHDVRTPGDNLPVMRISPPEPWRDVRARRWTGENLRVPRSELVAAGVYTSASGITVYRGAAYPKEYHGQIFTAEVANNLVQRQTVTPDGVTFRVEPADTEAEFIASTDIWFRPVNFANAPDGTLHLVDMYRETIEHPWSIPDDIRARLDLERGRDRGRLYRLTPPGFVAPKPPRLSRATTAELVATLENPHGWWRDTAQRLLFERQDTAAVEPLRRLAAEGASDVARLHALWTLDGLGALREADLGRALGDAAAAVREQAVKLAAPRIAAAGGELRARVWALAKDPAIRVRYAVAFAAGGVADEAATAVAVEILRQDRADKWVRAAALSGPPAQAATIAERVLAEPALTAEPAGRETLRQLLFVAGAHNRTATLNGLVAAWTARPRSEAEAEAFWTGLGDGLKQAARNLRSAFREAGSPGAVAAGALLERAKTTAADRAAAPAARTAAVRLLGYEEWAAARPVLEALLASSEAQPLQSAAVKALGGFTTAEVAKTLLAHWPAYTPALREEVLAALLARRERVAPLLDALEANVVNPGQVTAARRTQLLANPDPKLKVRAEKLFGADASGTRADVFARYRAQLGLKGDAARGARVYDNVCAACHRFAGRGIELGPNLETVRGWDREKLLLNIVDPNREVTSNYLAYTIELKDGGAVTGMIAEETAGSIKLRRTGAPEETILRQNIAKIAASAGSLMPEGLEASLPPQEMADLMTFLLGN
jgi:putative membrane-bound dehydrogenase-like protein